MLLAASAFLASLAVIAALHRPIQSVSGAIKASFDAAPSNAADDPRQSAPTSPMPAPATSQSAPSARTAGPAVDVMTSSPAPADSRVAVVSPTNPSQRWTSGVAWDSGSGHVSGGGLVASYCCAGALSTVVANRAVSSGRHYWELTLDTGASSRPPNAFTDAGVTKGQAGHRVVPAMPGGTTSAIAPGRSRRYTGGDTFMFALNADKSILHIGVNGEWLNGDAESGVGGARTQTSPGEPLRPYVNISAPGRQGSGEDRWIANFGSSPFRYPVPRGFTAYAGTSVNVATAPAAAPEGASLMGKILRGHMSLGGATIPLPEGDWTALAFFRGGSNGDGDSAVLARIEGDRLRGVIAGKALKIKDGTGFAAIPNCDRTDYVFRETQVNSGFGAQRCWWINHATGVWQQEPILRAAAAELERRGIRPPTVMLNVGFRRADADSFATTFYYFDPRENGISSQPLLWQSSEWHKDRIQQDSQRVQYVEGLKQWAGSWAPIYFATR
jgi:hypothetical protein